MKKRRVPCRAPDFLRELEVTALMDALDERWRPLFTTAVYTGMRKGEPLGLRKSDIDFQAGLIIVARSWDRDTTKGGRADAIPIAKELTPYLRIAVDAPASELVFPGKDGKMMCRDVALEAVLRRALGRAGIVLGYTHKCRRKGCGLTVSAPDNAPRSCTNCSMRLWPIPRVRPIRFHDLRHTAASLMLMRHVSLAAVQRILRHRDPKTTTEIYGHLLPGFLKAEVDRLALGLAPPP